MNTTLTDMHGMMEKAMPMDGGDVKADKSGCESKNGFIKYCLY